MLGQSPDREWRRSTGRRVQGQAGRRASRRRQCRQPGRPAGKRARAQAGCSPAAACLQVVLVRRDLVHKPLRAHCTGWDVKAGRKTLACHSREWHAEQAAAGTYLNPPCERTCRTPFDAPPPPPQGPASPARLTLHLLGAHVGGVGAGQTVEEDVEDVGGDVGVGGGLQHRLEGQHVLCGGTAAGAWGSAQVGGREQRRCHLTLLLLAGWQAGLHETATARSACRFPPPAHTRTWLKARLVGVRLQVCTHVRRGEESGSSVAGSRWAVAGGWLEGQLRAP